MTHSNFAAIALLKMRSVLGKPELTDTELSATTPNDRLTGATFLELEPGLAKEAGEYMQ